MGRANQKQLLFISHVQEEKEVAAALESLVKSTFLSMMDVFVSSIPLGKRWNDVIFENLKRASIGIVIASPVSVFRPWVNFEAGALCIRDVPVIPLCHSGMTPDDLPSNLGTVQAGMATDEKALRLIFPTLAQHLECTLPEVEYSGFIEAVKAFEKITAENTAITKSQPPYRVSDNLGPHEIDVMFYMAGRLQAPGAKVPIRGLIEDAAEDAWKPAAVTTGLAMLERRGLVESVVEEEGYNLWWTVGFTQDGWTWVFENLTENHLRNKRIRPPDHGSKSAPPDDIPF